MGQGKMREVPVLPGSARGRGRDPGVLRPLGRGWRVRGGGGDEGLPRPGGQGELVFGREWSGAGSSAGGTVRSRHLPEFFHPPKKVWEPAGQSSEGARGRRGRLGTDIPPACSSPPSLHRSSSFSSRAAGKSWRRSFVSEGRGGKRCPRTVWTQSHTVCSGMTPLEQRGWTG